MAKIVVLDLKGLSPWNILLVTRAMRDQDTTSRIEKGKPSFN